MGIFAARPVRPGRILTEDPPRVATRIVNTSKGPVIGFQPVLDAAFHFRGVPFADAGRFQPPQPRAPWGPAPLECFRFGAACHQDPRKSIGGLLGASVEEDLGVLGDDALNLNLVVPAAAPAAPLPVLVWVHGGSNCSGSNAQLGHIYPGDAFAARGVICVSLSYRLALHGFLHLPQQGVTNLAIRDIIAGLEWVRDEIAAFSGDPDSVTVWGQSAGGVNLATLLGVPRARGLFHKAVLVSGAPCPWASVEEYTETALVDFTTALRKEALDLRLHESGEPLLEDLQRLPPETISRAAGRVKDSMEASHGITTLPASFNALVDGDLLPTSPLEEIRGGAAAGVPLLLGSNALEMTDFARFIGGAMLGWTLGPALMSFLLRRRWFMAPEPALRLIAGRRRRSALPDAQARAACDQLIQSLGGDVEAAINLLATQGEQALASAQASHAPVFTFEIHLTPEESPRCGSGHGVDFALCFPADGPMFTDAQRATACRDFFGRDTLGEGLAAVAEGLRDSIVRFARSGDPGHFNGLSWPDAGKLILGSAPRFEAWPVPGEDPKRARLQEIVAGLG